MDRCRLNGLRIGPHTALKPVLRRWLRLVHSLTTEWAPEEYGADRDVPWWYGERTSIGFFAAACWKSGGQAIEEYSTIKISRSKRTRKQTYTGRGDLLFYFKNRVFVAEAKQNDDLSLDGSPVTLRRNVLAFLKGAQGRSTYT